MNRLVYTGGLNNGPADDTLLSALLDRFNVDDVDAYTFSEWANNPELVRRAMADRLAVTNSAGFLAAVDAHPSELVSIGAPLQTSVGQLLQRTNRKTLEMFRRGREQYGRDGSVAAWKYTRQSMGELATHPIANLGQLRAIARTDSIGRAGDLRRAAGIPVDLVYASNDEYFKPSTLDRDRAARTGVRVLEIENAEHDELVLRPDPFLAELIRLQANG